MARESDLLQAEASRLIKVLHDLAVARQAAISSGQQQAADQFAERIRQVTTAYNNIVQRLHEIEGPSGALKFLDRVGDVVISGVRAGASGALDIAGDVAAGVGQAAGRAVAGLTLPVIIPVGLLLVLLVWAAGKSGLLRVRR